MSGNYFQANEDAPGGLTDTAAQAETDIASAMQRFTERQAQAERFLVEHGAAVVGGHDAVGVVIPGE